MQTRPTISLLHPTRRIAPSEGFPRGWKDAHDAWMARADHPENIEYILSVHTSRWEEFKDSEAGWHHAFMSWREFIATENKGLDNNVANLNHAAAESSGKLLMGVMDDYYPPEHWDTLILGALAFHTRHERIILHCGTGATPERDRELMIGGAWTRPVYEHYGYILDPDFESMFADNWYAFCARRDAAAGLLTIIERLDIVFDHRHPVFTGAKLDEAYQQQNQAQAYQRGQALFLKKAYGTKSIAVCFPGETFRSEIFWERISLLLNMNKGMKLLVAPFGQHSSNVYHTRIAIARTALEQLPDVDFMFTVDDDNSCTIEQFQMLYQDLEDHPDLSGVVGWCWCDHNGEETKADGTPNPWQMSVGHQGSWEDGLPAWNFTLADFQKWAKEGKSLITSDDVAPDGLWSGFPCVLLRGDALRKLGPLAFAPLCHEKMMDGFTGEDASFFYRMRAAGLKFAVDLRVKVKHIKFRPIEPLALLPVAKQSEITQLPVAEAVMEASAAD